MKQFHLKVLNKLKILSKLNIIGKLTVNNIKFNIPVIKLNGYNNLFMSEIWMVEILNHLINDKMVSKKFIDVGVNIGQTLLKLRSVSQKMDYLGFEPNPLCVFYTNELIKANSLINKSNTTLYPVGISTNNEVLSLNLFSESEMDSSASIIEEFRDDRIIQKMHVPVLNANTIEGKTNIFKNVGIIKIDVEGAELEVLKSLKDVINKERPFILIEILPIYKSENEFRIKRQNEIESIFNELNYSIYRIEKKNNISFSNLKRIETIEIHSDLELCDYVISPKENNQLEHLIS